jgi:hypothetical protein
MVSFPPSWRNYAGHAVAGRGPLVDKRAAWRIGTRGTGQQWIVAVPVQAFTRQVQGVPLQGGQVTGKVPASGIISLSVTPQGLGTVWYPSSVNISTSLGAADNSTCAVYLGSIAEQNLQGGQSYAGGGDTVSLAVPSITAGQLVIAVWTGAAAGSLAAMNVLGTMDALAY